MEEQTLLKREFVTRSGRKIKIVRLVRALYGLNELDLNIYSTIKERKEVTLKDLIRITGKNKPLLIKSLQNLEKIGLISRSRIRNGEKGRPSYVYKITIDLENLFLNDLRELLSSID